MKELRNNVRPMLFGRSRRTRSNAFHDSVMRNGLLQSAVVFYLVASMQISPGLSLTNVKVLRNNRKSSFMGFRSGTGRCINRETKKSVSKTLATTEGSFQDPPFVSANFSRIQTLGARITELIQQQNHLEAYPTLQEMIRIVGQMQKSDDERISLCECVDAAIHTFTRSAFYVSGPNISMRDKHTQRRIILGSKAIYLQLQSATLVTPYNTVPESTLLAALRALTQLSEAQISSGDGNREEIRSLDLAFRILQRLVTGVGVRLQKNSRLCALSEKDFNMVLNAFSNAGRMDMAHRIVALQERTPSAPRPSKVTYSILLKGYGRSGDVSYIDLLVSSAEKNGIVPDTILLNSLIDAYINCNALAKARVVFEQMLPDTADPPSVFADYPSPRANLRTYNIMMKGLANIGDTVSALALADKMKQQRKWDSVTTNTLVHAAVVAKKYDMAEDMLTKRTFKANDKHYPQHPNVEAYTDLLDAYAKDGELGKAACLFELMKERSVQANEFTYTCFIAGLARQGEIEQAKQMLALMISSGLRPTSVTCSAFISAIIASSETSEDPDDLDSKVDQGCSMLRICMKTGIRPSTATIATIVEAMGRCRPPRVSEALVLVDKLESDKIIPVASPKVITAVIRACGYAGEVSAALDALRRLEKPDLVAINAFLSVCCKCNCESTALQVFEFHFRQKRSVYRLAPDVITYSTLISSLMKTKKTLPKATKLYHEMREQDKVLPDKTLIDIILKAMLRHAPSANLSRNEALFITKVLQDAELLTWDTDQLGRRKRAVQAVLADLLRDTWKKDKDVDQLFSSTIGDDLLQRKGWNKVDSGFSLWGRGRPSPESAGAFESSKDTPADTFLSKHGWNDVDSGFRIL